MKAKAEHIEVTVKGKTIKIPAGGKDIPAHFAPADALKVLELAESRARSFSQILVAAAMAGLPKIRKGFEVTDRRSTPENGNGKHLDARKLARFKIPTHGKIIMGHFKTDQAKQIYEAVDKNEDRSVSQVVGAAAMAGLSDVRKQFPKVH